MRNSPHRKSIPLFDERFAVDGAEAELRARLRDFARVVAKRHRRSSAGVAEFTSALRGYYRTLAICADRQVPRLDEALVAFATAEYLAGRASGRSAAA